MGPARQPPSWQALQDLMDLMHRGEIVARGSATFYVRRGDDVS